MAEMLFENNDTSSSSDEELLMQLIRNVKTKNEDYLAITVPQYTNNEFIEHFRVSKVVAEDIAQRFEQSEYFSYQSGEFGKLSGFAYTVIFLWYAGHEAASYRDVADRFNIAISTLRKVIERMIYFLSNLSPEVITWPTHTEQLRLREEFSSNGFLNVVGVIDGSHIRLDKPQEDPDSYINRKGYYSMHLQVVCDARRKIRDVTVGFPGSVHDSRVFQASPLSGSLREKCGENYILGDSGYPCLHNLLTPYKDFGNLTERQQNYNVKLAKTRYVIEHCFGILKQKFRQLYHLKLRGDFDIANFVRACCVLHNLALEDDFPAIEIDCTNDNAEVENHNPQIHQDERTGIEIRNHVANILPLARN